MADLEALFAQFPADVRLAILGALVDSVMLSPHDSSADGSADLLVRFGYPGSAESAKRARRSIEAARA